MKKYIFVFAVIMYTTIASTSCNNNKEEKVIEKTLSGGMDHSKMDHNKMEGNMLNMKMTGDFDVDFANTMMLHHQSAIDMAKNVLTKTTNADVIKIAQNIIKTQELEITEFKTILKFYDTSKINNNAEKRSNVLAENMIQMNSKMKAIPITGNADKDFLTMMIPHHESAILMGKDELNYGKNKDLKLITEKIIDDQNNEIEKFRVLIAQTK